MICQVQRWKDLERWVPDGATGWECIHPLVPLDDLLTPRLERVRVQQTLEEWTAITIHFDGSIVPRDRNAPFKGTMFSAYPGDLVLSKIDARNGAIGIIPNTLLKVVVTSEYPVHSSDPKQVDARYLALLLRTPNFLRLIRSVGSGTSGRKRIAPESFRAIEIPLPELKDQRQLVTAYERALGKAAELEAQAQQIERDAQREFEATLGLTPPPDLPKRPFQIARFKDIERWSHGGILQDALLGDPRPESRFEIVQLDDISTVSYGLQKCPANRPDKHPRPYLRVANVQRDYLDLREIKMINVPDTDMPKYRLENGDILLCEGNSADLVGRGAIWRNEIADCVHQNHVLRVRLDRRRAIPEFILAYINSPSGQAYFRSKAKRTTNLASINSKEVANLAVPLPEDTATQVAIVRLLRKGREAVASKRKHAAELRTAAWNDFIEAVFA
jgi:type I restriction enzyme, S subunit